MKYCRISGRNRFQYIDTKPDARGTFIECGGIRLKLPRLKAECIMMCLALLRQKHEVYGNFGGNAEITIP